MTRLVRGLDFGAAEGPEKQAQTVEKDVDLTWGVRIPMRDGVSLNGTLYRPKDDEPSPAIFTLTPYIADSYHDRAVYFAQRGYAFLLVDCRGRGNSAGAFEPFATEAEDGHDIVVWLAKQPWCSGDVAMWGGSYAGYNQWLTARERPAALKTIVPAAAAYAAVDFPFDKNIFYPYEMQWLTLVSGLTPNQSLFGEMSFWYEKYYELYTANRPFRELDQIIGNLSTHFQTWVDHPTPDDYWRPMMMAAADYEKLDLPILTITGHYDADQNGAMTCYREHMGYGTAAAKEQHYLIIGPWDHAGTRTPKREFGGLTFDEAAIIDLNKLHHEWYEWVMGDGPKPDFLQDRVAYYVMGEEVWKYAASLEAIPSQKRRFYLDSDGGQANDVFHSGFLVDEVSAGSQADSYVYDPLDARPAEVQREHIKEHITSQRYALNLFGNGLVYHSAPFAEATEISGYIRCHLWMAMDVVDTDFQVVLYEITQDGQSMQLAEDMMRARYRESLLAEKLVVPGEINEYIFDSFFFFSRQIAKGSRLRLLVKSPGSIHLQKNYNSGGVVAEESGKDAQTAHVTLYHDAEHPSYLEVPVVVT